IGQQPPIDLHVTGLNVPRAGILVTSIQSASTLPRLLKLGVQLGAPDFQTVTDGTLLDRHMKRCAPVAGRNRY
ncbi:MAG: hypothetical protein ACK56F_26550, partial [bacterium]